MNETEDQDVLTKPRWPWFAAGGVLYAAAAAASVSVYLLWLPCRGIMWDGTVFAAKVTGDIPEACSRRMDEGFPFVYFPQDVGVSPSASEAGGLAMMLAAASWIVLILGLRLSGRTTWIALSASVAPIVFAAFNWSAATGSSGGDDDYISGWLWFAVDVVAVVVFMVLLVRSQDIGEGANRDLSRRDLFGLAFVLWGATAFGAGHLLGDFITMVALNEYNWDVPPGTGWITVAVLVIAGSASLWCGKRPPSQSSEATRTAVSDVPSVTAQPE